MSNIREKEDNAFVLIVENQYDTGKMLKDKIKKEYSKSKESEKKEDQQSVFSNKIEKNCIDQSQNSYQTENNPKRADTKQTDHQEQTCLKNQQLSNDINQNRELNQPSNNQNKSSDFKDLKSMLVSCNQNNQRSMYHTIGQKPNIDLYQNTHIPKQKINQHILYQGHGKYEAQSDNKSGEISQNYFQDKLKISTIYEENSRLENNSSSLYQCSINDHNLDFKKETSPDQYSIIQKIAMVKVQDFDVEFQKNENNQEKKNLINQDQVVQKEN